MLILFLIILEHYHMKGLTLNEKSQIKELMFLAGRLQLENFHRRLQTSLQFL